jgi:eukaryotic-like serine/threonine-protein kinase
MNCPRCGRPTSVDTGRCTRCGASLSESAVVTSVLALDTTGLPPGATFGASTGLGTTGVVPGTDATAGTGISSLPAAVGPLRVGQSFGPRYHIIKLLGVGGMGAVYQAWDAELSVAVALKVIRGGKRRASSDLEKRFKNELLLARSVTHKNVVRIHDLGEIDNKKFITMSYVQGHDLATLLRRQAKFPIARALHLARQIAAGLEAAHEAGVVHRDLKPANIMIGADDLALIMDFGISASTEEAASGGVVGTLEYMAPEQGTGQNVDARADIYAFGLILYELLVGPRLVATTTPQERVETMKQRISGGVAPPRTLDPSIPEPLDAIVVRCLEKDPAARFQTTTELCAALARLDDAGERIPEQTRVTKRMMAAVAVLVLALVTGTYFVGRRGVPPPVHPPLSVLIADFENQTQDPILQGTIEQSLGIALEGASFITTYPHADAVRTAQQLGSSKGVDESTARLIALREGIGVVVAGSIEARGRGYRLGVRAEDAQAKELYSTTVDAGGKDEILKAVGQVASKLRDKFGDTTSDKIKQTDADSFTAASIDAVSDYVAAGALASAGRDEDAIGRYRAALAKDPNFGRAYSGWAVSAFKLGRSDEAAHAYKKAFGNLDRMTEREKLKTLGNYYLQFTGSYDKAIESYSELIRKYPADRGGHSNLAIAYFDVLNFSKAMQEGLEALRIYPTNLTFRDNYALFAMYAGDFRTASTEAQRVVQADAKFYKAYLPLAIAAIDAGNLDAARDAYTRMAAAGAAGASLSAGGMADLDVYSGRYGEAVAALRAAADADLKAQRINGAVAKYLALGDALLGLARPADAAKAAHAALAASSGTIARIGAARIFVRAGAEDEAQRIASELGQQLQAQNRAYAKIIEAEIALAHRRPADAIELLTAGRKFMDLWLGRFDLGIAYLQARAAAEAVAELDLAYQRRGEATALFLDDSPTVHVMAALSDWQRRAREALVGTQAPPAGRPTP